MTSSAIEDQIVSLFEAGDDRAMELLYDHYADTLYGVIFRMVGNEAQALDILQDALVKVWKNSSTYDPSKGKLFTWLMRIVRNQTIDFIRKQRRSGEIYGEATDVIIEVTPADTRDFGLNYDIGTVLDQLDDLHRDLIECSYIFGYTHPQIAKRFKMPLGTVKTKIRAAMIQLKNIFQDGR